MMLDPELRLDAGCKCEARAPVAGMQIVGDCSRRDPENLLQAAQRLFEELHRFEVLQIADVLAQDSVSAFGEAEGVLQFADKGKHLVQFDAQVDGLGDKPS